MAPQTDRILQEVAVNAEGGTANAAMGEKMGISVTRNFGGDRRRFSAFGWINRKRKLLEGSESEACRGRSRNGDDKSASKMGELGTRKESDCDDAKNMERGDFLISDSIPDTADRLSKGQTRCFCIRLLGGEAKHSRRPLKKLVEPGKERRAWPLFRVPCSLHSL
jgi:hypothetical protein